MVILSCWYRSLILVGDDHCPDDTRERRSLLLVVGVWWDLVHVLERIDLTWFKPK